MTRKKAAEIYESGKKATVKTICALYKDVKNKDKEINRLRIKIAKLSKDSTNSSRRPSSDDITKKTKTEAIGGEKRKKGGQPGHPKHTREPFSKEEIDLFAIHPLKACPTCNGKNLCQLDKSKIVQQMDITDSPLVKIEVHRSYAYECKDCGKIHYSPLPVNVIKAGLLKEGLTAFVAYMKNVCHASFSTIRKFFRDILKQPISRSLLSKAITKVSQALDAPYEELLDRIPLEIVINVDETGHKDNGDKFWTWVFKAELYVLFKIDKSRGSKVLVDVLGENFAGVIGCDYFSSYRKYIKDFNVLVQFCLAHIIRDIKFLTGLPDEATKTYGEKLLAAFKSLFKTIHEKENMTDQAFTKVLKKIKTDIIRIAIEEVPSHLNSDGKEEKKEAKNMANRFRKFGDGYFEFITTPGIDPTNNKQSDLSLLIVI